MVGAIGRLALAAAAVSAVAGIVFYMMGVRRVERRWTLAGHHAVRALAGLTTIAVAALVYLLMSGDFRYAYVAATTSRSLEPVYKFAALWGGNAGSLLLWLWLLAVAAAAVVRRRRPESERLLPWVGSLLLGVALFFTLLLQFAAPPFQPAPEPMADGLGLNPLLRHPGMLLHPVFLYAGYVGFTIPYAYAMAARLSGGGSDTWVTVTRRWTLLAWLFLSLGILYGARWAYEELGWGGYWAWDPVENAALMPWLLGTAFLHTALVQERKGMLRGWNTGLISATWLMTLFGTFLTRSGVLVSVHAFAEGPLGVVLLAFIGVMTLFSIWAAALRPRLLSGPHRIGSLLSKEASFLLNNLLLTGIAFAVLWGTMLPITSELFTGIRVGVGAPFFTRVNLPLGIVLVLLMGICPLLPWRQGTWGAVGRQMAVPLLTGLLTAGGLLINGVTNSAAVVGLGTAALAAAGLAQEFARGAAARRSMTGEPWPVAMARLCTRNRRRYGGYLVHLAVVLMVVGFTGAVYNQERTFTLKPGRHAAIGDYTLVHRGVWAARAGGRTADGTAARTVVYAGLNVARGDRELGVLWPEKVFYAGNPQPTTEAAILGSLREDLYVVLGGWDEGQEATYQVYLNPLVAWIWIGQYLLLAGTLFAMWPQRAVPAAVRPAGMQVAPFLKFLLLLLLPLMLLVVPVLSSLLPGAVPKAIAAAGTATARTISDTVATGTATARTIPETFSVEIGTDPAVAQLDERVREVARQVRCPLCKNLSAWDSDTIPAREIVADIRARLAAGQSEAAVLRAYEEMYGPWILMAPPRRGAFWIAWLVPLAAMAAGAGVLTRLLCGRARGAAASGAPDPSSGSGIPDPQEAEPIDPVHLDPALETERINSALSDPALEAERIDAALTDLEYEWRMGKISAPAYRRDREEWLRRRADLLERKDISGATDPERGGADGA
ncbi:MAG: cytochrome c biogenesis protein CcsA [Firmicutes bacterium]|nr:cytochrome c biogenesis protein CcsA [Bacillota bacterium]